MAFTFKRRDDAHHLTDLEVSEISLVDKPANRGAKVLLVKRDEDEQKETTKMNLTDKESLAAFMRDGVATMAKSDASTLESIAAWLHEHQTANKQGKVDLAKALEHRCPSVADVDEALDELTEATRKVGEAKYKAYERALASTAGRELYALRHDLQRCGSDGSAYSNAWDVERQSSRGIR